MSRKCEFSELSAGDWFIMDGEIYQKDAAECAVSFNTGRVHDDNATSNVEFIKSVELIYD